MIKDNYSIQDSVRNFEQSFTGRQSMIWTALPGIVQSFDADAITCEVSPAIQGKRVLEDGTIELVNLPILLDCPVVFPHAGGNTLTFPIKPGDECLVIFSCRAIDQWWIGGGIQPPAETRMHDLSDGFVIPGPWSQMTKIAEVSTERVELRSDDHKALISIHPTTHEITLETTGDVMAKIDGNVTATVGGTLTAEVGGNTSIKCPKLTVDCPDSTFTGAVKIQKTLAVTGQISGMGGFAISGGSGGATATVSGSLKATGDVTASGISLTGHVHGGVQGGSSKTGGPQ